MSVGFVVEHPLDRGLSDPKTGRDRGDRLSRAGKPDCFEGLVVGERPVWDPFLPRLHQRGMVDQVGAVGDPPEVLDRVIPVERKRDRSDIAKSGDFSACPYCQ